MMWLVEAILLGILIARRWMSPDALKPLWAGWLLVAGIGAAFGMGVASCLFFVFGVLFHSAVLAMIAELSVLAAVGFDLFRRRGAHAGARQQDNESQSWPALLLFLSALLVIAIGIGTAGIAAAWSANPHGNWDAWAIWNLRAKFLASDGGLAVRAWSPVLREVTHPEYPLLLSGFIARCWAFTGSVSMEVPAAVSYVFFFALIAVATGGVAVLRGNALGLSTGLVLAATPSLLHQVAAQYADVPLACYLAAALVLALLDRPLLAGAAAAFAAWTKDEGLVFLAIFVTAMAVFRRRQLLVSLAGAAPVALLVLFFKTALSPGLGSVLGTAGAGERFATSARYATVLAAFGRGFAGMASGWYHPVLPLAILAIGLRFDRRRQRDVAFCGAVCGVLLAVYFGVYIASGNDLNWLLSTSLDRLLVQVWPLAVLTMFVSLRAPESLLVESDRSSEGGRSRARRMTQRAAERKERRRARRGA